MNTGMVQCALMVDEPDEMDLCGSSRVALVLHETAPASITRLATVENPRTPNYLHVRAIYLNCSSRPDGFCLAQQTPRGWDLGR